MQKCQDVLSTFDSLPDSANVRQPVVEALFACSAATVWRMVKRETLPAPRKISPRINCWNVGQLRYVLMGSATECRTGHKKETRKRFEDNNQKAN